VANFRPFKRYILYCLDRMVDAYEAKGPFLDVGCGIGDVSLHLAETTGWQGKAIDLSDVAITRASEVLSGQPGIVVERHSVEDEKGIYSTVVMLDVLEHIEDDQRVLRAVAARLAPDGYAFIGVPSNPEEWRWDDDLYGHLRRYRAADLMGKLRAAGLETVVVIDITYPVFWLMRRAFTRLLRKRSTVPTSAHERTLASTSVNAWHVPLLGPILSRGDRLWELAYPLQFRFFRHRIDDGHELLAVVRKTDHSHPER
jgi:SAM-dependent methyltransferase